MSDFWEGFAAGSIAIGGLGLLLYWLVRIVIPYAIELVINRFER